MSKVIVSLFGGLGNQLFQYASGRSLALRNNARLILDTGWFDIVDNLDSTTVRKYELNSFKLNCDIQTMGLPWQKKSILSPLYRRLPFFAKIITRNTNIYNEKSFKFDMNLFNQKLPIWLNGYWQSYKYFDSIDEVIKQDIESIKFLNTGSQKILKMIQSSESICVHVRRGDYVLNPKANKMHGLCSIHYYNEAIKLITKYLSKPVLYIFSDDPEWVRVNLSFSYKTIIVDINDIEEVCQDLWLMKSCNHFVIANSSLSWWAAWLSSYKEKIVIAPKKWFANNTYDSSDLIPEDWIKI